MKLGIIIISAPPSIGDEGFTDPPLDGAMVPV